MNGKVVVYIVNLFRGMWFGRGIVTIVTDL